MTATEVPDYYAEFGISTSATPEEIGKHLDREHRSWAGKASKAPSAGKRREAEDKVRRVLDARKALTDPSARALYDQRLARAKKGGPRQPPRPEPVQPTLGGTVRDWVGAAQRLIDAGDLQAAAYELRQAVHHDDRNAFAWRLLGAVHTDLGEYRDALQEHRRALELEPDDAGTYYLVGSVYTALGDRGTALTWYMKAATLAPGDLETEIAIGDGLYAASSFDEALSWYEKALGESPGHAGLRNQIARIWSLRAEGAMVTHPYTRRLVVAAEDAAQRVLHCVDQGLAVHPGDPELVGRLEFFGGLARDALRKTWHWRGSMLAVLVAGVLLAFAAGGRGSNLYSVLILAAVAAFLAWLGYRPRWFHTRKSLPRHARDPQRQQQPWSNV
ncbi:tetratricopeptide repeat protein [Streptomyces sp. NPDC058691]|uniref:tetratricopeptide repeat protein n=1 Tax=Streptomyces sp. NPDC058691 TaxID=3346601 RepID=UPI0036479012